MDHTTYADLSALFLVIIYYLGHALHELRHLLRLAAAKFAEAVQAKRWRAAALTVLRYLLIVCIQTSPFFFYCLHMRALCFPDK